MSIGKQHEEFQHNMGKVFLGLSLAFFMVEGQHTLTNLKFSWNICGPTTVSSVLSAFQAAWYKQVTCWPFLLELL